MRKTILAVLLTICLMAPLYAGPTSPALVTDISDRAYEPAVVKLLDGARESIVMSMYLISLSTQSRSPLSMLLEDLTEARGRGVAVTIYLNTRFKKGAEAHPTIYLKDGQVVSREDSGL